MLVGNFEYCHRSSKLHHSGTAHARSSVWFSAMRVNRCGIQPQSRLAAPGVHFFILFYFILLYFTLLYFTLLYFTLLYFTLLYFSLLPTRWHWSVPGSVQSRIGDHMLTLRFIEASVTVQSSSSTVISDARLQSAGRLVHVWWQSEDNDNEPGCKQLPRPSAFCTWCLSQSSRTLPPSLMPDVATMLLLHTNTLVSDCPK